MPFIKLEKILSRSIKKSGLQDSLDSVKIFEVCLEVIAEIMGDEVKIKVKPLKLDQGILELACMSNLTMDKCKKYEARILFELNRPFHRKVVNKIKFIY